MSRLPSTNGEEAQALFNGAFATHQGAIWHSEQGQQHWKSACRGLFLASELALKAGYVMHELEFQRTHQIEDLYDAFPHPAIQEDLKFTTQDLERFSPWYLSPYFSARPVTRTDLQTCESISTRMSGGSKT